MERQNSIKEYVRLRTMLDSLEDGCLRYFLDHQDEAGERFAKLQKELMPVIEWVWGDAEAAPGCPPGYNNCDGVCVPYTCPRGTEPPTPPTPDKY